MIYTITIYVVRFIILLLNGRIHVKGKEHLPSQSGYVLVAPHRSWLDPVLLAIAIYPKPITVMAKQELFSNPLFSWFIRTLGAFPVDREHPGPSVIKHPVKQLKEEQRALIIFPTGTRYATEMKGGASTIARLSKTPIVPAVYQGPFTFKDVLKRQPMTVAIGKPVSLEGLSKEEIARIDDQFQTYFDHLDATIDATFTYQLPQK